MTAHPYDALLDDYRTYLSVHGARSMLQWDEYVTMPSGSRKTRSRQLSALASVANDRITDPALGRRLDDIDDDDLTDDERAVVREIRHTYERNTRVPAEIEERLADLTSAAVPAWTEAKETDDFDEFAPHLREIVAAKREYAAAVDPDADPHAVLVGEYVPQLDYGRVESVLTTVRDELLPLLASIRESEVTPTTGTLAGDYDPDEQLAAARDVLDLFGFDWDRGRLDTFDMAGTVGLAGDARVCTRTDDSLYQTLFATAHEGGHALYSQGLPEEQYGTPLGRDRGVFVQESQAAFWEHHVFGHRAFWEQFLPTLRERFPDLPADPQAAYESVTSVRAQNPVWTEADELTAQLHVLLRFELERDLLAGDVAVAEVPQVWNDRVESSFDVRPDSLAEGCLQDIHWAQGNLGYFPTYTLGTVLAAQLRAALERDLGGLGNLLRAGEFDAIREWHRDRIYRHGRRYTTAELIERVTGGPLSADDFVRYATEKYADLYDL